MTGGIDNEKTGNVDKVLLAKGHTLYKIRSLFDTVERNICSTDLLRDSASFIVLYICTSKIVQSFSLSSIDVAKDTDNWRTEVVLHRIHNCRFEFWF